MIDDFTTQIHPVLIDKIPLIQEAAKADNHAVFAPTDVIIRDGQIVGALEIASTPCVFWWMHTDRTTIRDSIMAYQFYENQVRRLGAKHVVVPCPTDSPFYQLLSNPKSGYMELPKTVVFMKQLRI